MNSTNKFLLIMVVFLLFCWVFLTGQFRISRTRPANIPFVGNATGGTLILGYVESPHFVYIHNVSINTSAGESAESVVKRLAQAVVYSEGIFWKLGKNPNAETIATRMAQGNTLSIEGVSNRYFLFAGTETGLGIPKPPLSLSCAYNKKARTFKVRWINPTDEFGYDSVLIRWRYNSIPPDTRLSGGARLITDKPTSYTIKISSDINDLDTDVWIYGFRHEKPTDELRANDIPLFTNAIPSNVAAINVSSNGYCQQETDGIPFTSGVAPNWSAWSTAEKIDKTSFGQENKYTPVSMMYKPIKAFSTKPYYQIIKAPPQGVAQGVYRKFLGLTPGHTYRIIACLNTLEMDSIESDWSLSLCATHNGTNRRNLTARQLAGLDALPNGNKGTEAGRITAYSRGKTTKNDFAIVVSGDKGVGGPQSSNITLPPDANEITVWLRFSCEDSKGKVGFSGVKLEDISAIPNPKSPEQIVMEENQKEVDFFKYMQRLLPSK